MYIFTIAVQFNTRIKRDSYIKYKGLYMKYRKCNRDCESDALSTFSINESENDLYMKMTEFVYAHAYARHYNVLVSSGGSLICSFQVLRHEKIYGGNNRK